MKKPGDLRLDDPYLEWAFGTGFEYLGGPDKIKRPRIPLLIELQGKTVQEFWTLAERPELQSVISVPAVYGQGLDALKPASFCTASVTPDFFQSPPGTPALEELHRAIKRFELGLPGLGAPQTLPSARVSPRASSARVLTAVMDDGLAFAHRRFRRADGTTRVEYLWNQGKGLVLPGSAIDTMLAACTHAGLVDEDEVYRRLGHEDYLSGGHKTLGRRAAHGTHVMDLACGETPGTPEEERLIVGVQFPSEAVRDTSGAWLTPHVLLGLWFVLFAAQRIATQNGTGPLPVVVNVSYGKFADSHDGQSPLERAIDELVQLWKSVAPLAVVLPSGNSYLARCHASFSLAPGARRTLRWRASPDDRTPSFLEIWPGPVSASGAAPDLEVTVVAPPSGPALTVSRGKAEDWPASGPPLCSAIYKGAGSQLHRDRIQLMLAPTATLHPSAPVAPAGTWEIIVENKDPNRAAGIEAWIQRDDTPYGWPITGRQSRFDDPKYVRFDPSERYVRSRAAGLELAVDTSASCVKRAGSINAIATGNETVVIGAFRKSDQTAAGYSAGAPLEPEWKRVGFNPDAMAVGDDSVYCGGVLAAGTRSGSCVAMRGTSVAAPQVTRWIADQMAAGPLPPIAAAGPGPSPNAVRAAVQALAAAKAPLPGALPIPTERKGAGLMDVRPPPRVSRSSPD